MKKFAIVICLILMVSLCNCRSYEIKTVLESSKVYSKGTSPAKTHYPNSKLKPDNILERKDTLYSISLPTEIDTDDPIKAYYAFIQGEILGVNKIGNVTDTFSIDSLSYYDNVEHWVKEYAFYDFTKNGTKDLILGGEGRIPQCVLTFYNKQVILVKYAVPYEYLLSNGTIMYHRREEGDSYRYLNGETEISFECNPRWHNPENRYVFKDKWVTKEEWEELTKPYLSIPLADIPWQGFDEDVRNSKQEFILGF